VQASQLITSRRAVYDGPYGFASLAALAQWRSSLFRNTLAWRKLHNTTFTNGHMDYELFTPFLTCPPGMQLERIGGDAIDAGNLQHPVVYERL
jgi:hypothetical protein